MASAQHFHSSHSSHSSHSMEESADLHDSTLEEIARMSPLERARLRQKEAQDNLRPLDVNVNPKSLTDNPHLLRQLIQLTTPRMTRYTFQYPTERQCAFLLLPVREAFYGGAAGGGKSSALLMAATQYLDVPNYAALLLRKSFADLKLPGALMDRANQWFQGTDARWIERDQTWKFPIHFSEGAAPYRRQTSSISFGYLDNTTDKYRYQSAEFQFIGFDELTQFRENDYRFMFSRLRRLVYSSTSPYPQVPIRMRSASNPGGFGHEWVKQRFIKEGLLKGRVFIPAKLDDNPHLDRDDYIESLLELDPTTLAQMLEGNWEVVQGSGFFRKEWFNIVRFPPIGPNIRWVRFWDCASKIKKHSSWTAGGLQTVDKDGYYYIGDMIRVKLEYPDLKALVVRTARRDPPGTIVGIEDTSAGIALAQDLRRLREMRPYTIRTVSVPQDKPTRAGPWASRAKAGLYNLVVGGWITDFLDELVPFFDPDMPTDQIDSISGGYALLAGKVDKVVRGIRR